jgi:hypothetical protein
LSKLAENIKSDLCDIHAHIVGSHAITTAHFITGLIDKLIQSFNSILLLVIVYIIPLLPNSISSPNELQNSLVACNNVFVISDQNCTRAAQACHAAT